MSDVFGSIISGAFQMGAQKKQFEQNLQLQNMQNAFNLDMWQRENEYNSPAAQMKRLQEAGLNPNLMYGQGTTGNASSAPHMSLPSAPDYSRGIDKLAQAFNIEGLMTTVANTKKAFAEAKKAKADAKNAEVNAERNRQAFEGEKQFGLDYTYDNKTGHYVEVPEQEELEVIAFPYARYLKNRVLAENARRTFLLPFQKSAYEASTKLNRTHNTLLQPQIQMRRYDAEMYPYHYWIGEGSKIGQTIFDAINIFKPRRLKTQPVQYQRPINNYNYYGY